MAEKHLVINDHSERAPDERILQLSGPLLLENFFPFQKLVREDQSRKLILDMTAVPYIDSAGIGALVGVYVSRQKNGRTLLLVGVCERVRTTLQIAQVATLFTFVDKLTGAGAAAST